MAAELMCEKPCCRVAGEDLALGFSSLSFSSFQDVDMSTVVEGGNVSFVGQKSAIISMLEEKNALNNIFGEKTVAASPDLATKLRAMAVTLTPGRGIKQSTTMETVVLSEGGSGIQRVSICALPTQCSRHVSIMYPTLLISYKWDDFS